MSTPDLQLQTLFVFDTGGRMTATREPGGNPPPAFVIIRSTTNCAWALRADVPDALAREIAGLARDEPPARELRDAPKHADRYLSLLGGEAEAGPAFTFPDLLESPSGVVELHDEQLLHRNFRGWVTGEIAEVRAPVIAVLDDGHAVSVCFCARRSDVAAEAGLDTAAAFRGRGFGPRATAAWAAAIRATGRIPLYSTSWSNAASLAVARKLQLAAYANDWSVSG